MLALSQAQAADLKDLTLLGFAPGQELSASLNNSFIKDKSVYVEINGAVAKRLGVRDYGEEPMPLAHFVKLAHSSIFNTRSKRRRPCLLMFRFLFKSRS